MIRNIASMSLFVVDRFIHQIRSFACDSHHLFIAAIFPRKICRTQNITLTTYVLMTGNRSMLNMNDLLSNSCLHVLLLFRTTRKAASVWFAAQIQGSLYFHVHGPVSMDHTRWRGCTILMNPEPLSKVHRHSSIACALELQDDILFRQSWKRQRLDTTKTVVW